MIYCSDCWLSVIHMWCWYLIMLLISTQQWQKSWHALNDVICSCFTCICSVGTFLSMKVCCSTIPMRAIKSFIQGFFPGLRWISPKHIDVYVRGWRIDISVFIGKKICIEILYLHFLNVFLASIITGSALEQLQRYLHQSANQYVLHENICSGTGP